MDFRLGYVKYLNTLPLVEGLEALQGVQMVAAAPAKLGPLLSSGGLDAALASVIDAARSEVPLTLLTCGMIGCDGPTMTVRLFSAVPPARIQSVHADTDSHTSVALVQIILAQMHGIRPAITDYDARERIALSPSPASTIPPTDPQWPESLLLIGDKVATDPPPSTVYPHQLDLGEEWRKLTGLPFVYAVWMCRSADADSPRLRAIADLLDRQRRRNLLRLGWIVERFANQRRWPLEQARTYVGSLLRYEIGPRERLAVDRFLADAADLGLAPRHRPVWIDEPAVLPVAG